MLEARNLVNDLCVGSSLLPVAISSKSSICNASFIQYSVLQTLRKHKTLPFMANYGKIILVLLTRSGAATEHNWKATPAITVVSTRNLHHFWLADGRDKKSSELGYYLAIYGTEMK
ncbi:hypothetical protein EUGRSUZ_K01872 [Eucalyptus grandis]|uniref:Uncharacterized protein n=2 Tax=Eucalyptus grandis TaxID=71139 RepID=A0ACC3IW40_EUCGR|nr:hypothetical protein EUGRSUZ_K01872 [Eucalyptus grandis]